jgi:predicted nucleotidyltransferase
METKNQIINKLRELKPILLSEYSVKEIGIFGSYANETHTEESDIDILVEFDKPIGWKFFSLELYLEKIFGKKVDLVTKNALKDQIKIQIMNQLEYV